MKAQLTVEYDEISENLVIIAPRANLGTAITVTNSSDGIIATLKELLEEECKVIDGMREARP